jgi:hypothetical protein
MALALGAVDRGWSCDELYAALVDPAHGGGDKVRELARTRGEREARRYVRATYETARRRARLRPPIADPTDPGVQAVRAVVNQLRTRTDIAWSGMGGATDHAVYRVHLDTAARVGRLTYTLDSRTVAEWVPCDERTARRAHGRLIARGLLRLDHPGRGLHASSWTLDDQTCPHTLTLPPVPLRGTEYADSSGHSAAYPPEIARDAWVWSHRRRRGLGHAARRVHDALGDDPVSVRDLGDRLGARDRAVRRHLGRLEAVGLAVPVGRRWRRGRDVDVATVAVQRGTAGATAYRRDLHVAARAVHRAGLALGVHLPVARSDGGWTTAGAAEVVALCC